MKISRCKWGSFIEDHVFVTIVTGTTMEGQWAHSAMRAWPRFFSPGRVTLMCDVGYLADSRFRRGPA